MVAGNRGGGRTKRRMGGLRVLHEITGTIGRPRYVIGARRDEGA